jgi:hypothetical protein
MMQDTYNVQDPNAPCYESGFANERSSISLREMTIEEMKRQYRRSRPDDSSSLGRVRICPIPPGNSTITQGSFLAPITLDIEGHIEKFLWDPSDSDLHSEMSFVLQLLADLKIEKPRIQLIEFAKKLAKKIREQVQQFREAHGAVHCWQGLPGEQLLTLGLKNEPIMWDLAHPLNSPEVFARITARDLNYSSTEAAALAHTLSTELKEYKMRLARTYNIITSNLPDITLEGVGSDPLHSMEIEANIYDTIPPYPRRKESTEKRAQSPSGARQPKVTSEEGQTNQSSFSFKK